MPSLPLDFVELKYDGSTMGNLGCPYVGGILGDGVGLVVSIFLRSSESSLSQPSKNGALRIRLHEAHRLSSQSIMVEGD